MPSVREGECRFISFSIICVKNVINKCNIRLEILDKKIRYDTELDYNTKSFDIILFSKIIRAN